MQRHLLSIGLVGAALAAGGCGDSGPAQPAAAKPAQEPLERYLVRDREEPGFKRVGSSWTDGFAGLTSGGEFSEEGKRVLRRSGFVKIAAQRLEGPDGPGLSNVQLFETADGARRWQAYDQRTESIRSQIPDPAEKIRRFTVPGVPGARGWSASGFANVSWVQGRCVLLLGNADNTSAESDLAAGVRAIHRRTKGQCA